MSRKFVVFALVCALGIGVAPARLLAGEGGAEEEPSVETLEKQRKRNAAFEVVGGIFTGLGGAITVGGGALLISALAASPDCGPEERHCGSGVGIATGLGLTALGIGLPVGGLGLWGYIVSHNHKKEAIRKLDQRKTAAAPELRLRATVAPTPDGLSVGLGLRF